MIIAWVFAFALNWSAFVGLQVVKILLALIGPQLRLWTWDDAIGRANRQAYILRVGVLSAVGVGCSIVEVVLILQLHISLRGCDNVLGHFDDFKDFASFFALWLLFEPGEIV